MAAVRDGSVVYDSRASRQSPFPKSLRGTAAQGLPLLPPWGQRVTLAGLRVTGKAAFSKSRRRPVISLDCKQCSSPFPSGQQTRVSPALCHTPTPSLTHPRHCPAPAATLASCPPGRELQAGESLTALQRHAWMHLGRKAERWSFQDGKPMLY